MLSPGTFDVIGRAGDVVLVKEHASDALYMAYERSDGSVETATRVTALEPSTAFSPANAGKEPSSPGFVGTDTRRSRKETNKELAEALRARNKDRRGETWERAKMFVAQGKSVAEAADLA